MAAKWVALEPTWRSGYPQPRSNDNGWLEVTIDEANACKQCGQGAQQFAPFRMSTSPKWGACGLMRLHWINYQVFCRPDVWEAAFGPFGIDAAPVLNSHGTKVLNDVVQLKITAYAELELEGLRYEICRLCGSHNYYHIEGSQFPALVSCPTSEVSRTRQVFGPDSPDVNRPLIVSRGVFNALQPFALKKLRATPLSESSLVCPPVPSSEGHILDSWGPIRLGV